MINFKIAPSDITDIDTLKIFDLGHPGEERPVFFQQVLQKFHGMGSQIAEFLSGLLYLAQNKIEFLGILGQIKQRNAPDRNLQELLDITIEDVTMQQMPKFLQATPSLRENLLQ